MDTSRVMTERVRKIYDIVRRPNVVFSVEKARLFTEAFRRYEGDPDVIRTARAQAYVMDNIPIFMFEGDLIAGSPSAKPMGVEADFWGRGVWTPEGIEALRAEEYSISDEDAETMYRLSDYWRKITPDYKILDLYDDNMWAWRRSGYLLPYNETLEQAAGLGYAQNGMSISSDTDHAQIDYGYVLKKGLNAIIKEANEELAGIDTMSLATTEDIEKVYLLRAMIIIDEAMIRWVGRFADMAEQKAAGCSDPTRRRELLDIAASCRRIPGNPPETMLDALHFVWFLFLMISCGTTTPIGRADQYLLPYYEHDRARGVSDEEILELLECFRLKFMQMKNTSGGTSRLKWSGQARWNNVTLGGVDRNGKDATNPLTYLFMEAAYRCRTPHHTLSLRVHKGTPERVLEKATELVQTGIGMPSFVSDDSYIENLVQHGVPLAIARDYYIIGCVDVTVPEGYGHLFCMVVTSLPFDTYLHDGYSPLLKLQIGPHTGDVRKAETYEDFLDGLITHTKYYMEHYAQEMRLRHLLCKDVFQDAFTASLLSDGIKVGKTGRKRDLPYGIGPTINVGVGTVNIGDALAAVKKLVYDEKRITMDELIKALDENWAGERNQEIRRMCLSVKKYGNNDDETDQIVSGFYDRLIEAACSIDHYRGGKYCAAGMSITAHDPGGRLTGATPDGRYAGETLADGAASPAQGRDVHGPVAMLNSAMKLPQVKLQSLLLNMKLHPTTLRTEDDRRKLAALIRTYLTNGGKQIQFNVVDNKLLLDAQRQPEQHTDLIVRVAGYSAYFVTLSQNVQNEIIARTTNMQL